jgi:hypothetical protein
MASLGVDGWQIQKAEKESVLSVLADQRQPDVVSAIVNDAHAHADWLADGAKQLIPPGPIACRERCSFCCYLRVVTTIPEVLHIAAKVSSDNNSEKLEALRRRIEEYCDATRGLDVEGRRRLRIACPLLVDGLCSVYAVRPLSCRGWNSLDVSGCEGHFLVPSRGVNVPVYGPQYQINAHVQAGITAGLGTARLQQVRVELVDALRISLEVPHAATRWLCGEQLFAAAD